MMAISKDKRRATQDIDLDFIRYSLEDSAIVEFIKKLKQEYDFILLDCPPVLLMSDYLHIASFLLPLPRIV